MALSLGIASQFGMLAPLNSQHFLRSAVGLNTSKPLHKLLCTFTLFPESRLSLPTIAALLPVIMPLALGVKRTFAFLVLCHFVGLVPATPLAASPAHFGNVHHVCKSTISTGKKLGLPS